MTPYKLHSDPLAMLQTKSELKGASPYFYVPKYHFSDALPVPEIFDLHYIIKDIHFYEYYLLYFYNSIKNNFFLYLVIKKLYKWNETNENELPLNVIIYFRNIKKDSFRNAIQFTFDELSEWHT